MTAITTTGHREAPHTVRSEPTPAQHKGIGTGSKRRIGLARKLLAVSSVVAVLSACGGGAGGGDTSAEPLSDSQKALYSQAVEAGGQLKVFIGTTGTDYLDRMREVFTSQFPDINLEFISGNGPSITERFLTERRNGLNSADVVAIAGVESLKNIAAEGYIAQYVPDEAALYTSNPATFVEGTLYAFAKLPLGTCYNPTRVTGQEKELLKDYSKWTDPVFTDRAAFVNASGFSGRLALTFWTYQLPTLGTGWLEGLAKLHPTVYESPNTASKQVIAGEHDVLFGGGIVQAAQASENTAPLTCVTADPTPAYPFSISLVKDGPNTAAGKLFINWLMSETGQREMQETMGFQTMRQGFDEPVTSEEYFQQNGTVEIVDEQLLDKNIDQLIPLIDGMFGGGQS